MKKTTTLSLIIITVLCISCSIFSAEKRHAKQGYQKAIVTVLELDGCGWMIQLEDGSYLEPLNLTKEFKEINTEIWVKYTEDSQHASVCMAGKIVTITDIKKR